MESWSYFRPCAQEQGVRRISDGARGGLGVGPLRREPRTCRSRERGQHGQLAAPTVAAPSQAAKLGRLEDIGPPPASLTKKMMSAEAGEGRPFKEWPSLSTLLKMAFSTPSAMKMKS